MSRIQIPSPICASQFWHWQSGILMLTIILTLLTMIKQQQCYCHPNKLVYSFSLFSYLHQGHESPTYLCTHHLLMYVQLCIVQSEWVLEVRWNHPPFADRPHVLPDWHIASACTHTLSAHSFIWIVRHGSKCRTVGPGLGLWSEGMPKSAGEVRDAGDDD